MGEKGEEKVRRRLRERGRSYIHGIDAAEDGCKSSKGQRDPQNGIHYAIITGAGSHGGQKGGSMAAVSSAPLTVTTYRVY